MRLTLGFCLALSLGACAPAEEPGSSSVAANGYAAALTDPQRPQADRDRDAARLPADVLAFAQIAPGEKVGDYIMGGGYWTRLLSNAVGPQGKVYAFQPDEFIAFRPAYGDEQNAAATGRANVVALRGPVAAPRFPEKLDTIITVQNMHDLYLGAMPQGTAAKALKALFTALKPGGTYFIDGDLTLLAPINLRSRLEQLQRVFMGMNIPPDKALHLAGIALSMVEDFPRNLPFFSSMAEPLNPEARNVRHTYLTRSEDKQTWRVQQMLIDENEENDWVAEFVVE